MLHSFRNFHPRPNVLMDIYLFPRGKKHSCQVKTANYRNNYNNLKKFNLGGKQEDHI